jgi:general secretion pathway protein G
MSLVRNKQRIAQTNCGGFSLLELITVMTILSGLALGVLPVFRNAARRHREERLREALRDMREAVQDFRRDTVGMPCQGEPGTFGWQTGDSSALYIDPRSKVVISDCGLFAQDNPDRYPPSLEILVEGVPVVRRGAELSALGSAQSSLPTPVTGSLAKKRYLREIPVDPMTGRAEWNLRSSFDSQGASSWGGENVFTVSSTSNESALNGEKYSDW